MDDIDEELCKELDLLKVNKGYLVHPQTPIGKYIQDKQYYFKVIEKLLHIMYKSDGQIYQNCEKEFNDIH